MPHLSHDHALHSPAAEWRHYWPVVLAAFLGMALNTVHLYSTGIFIAPLEDEFGWSRTQITSGFTLYTFVGAAMAPFVGALIDRFGPRRLGMAGVALYCAGLAALSLATADIYSWWALWLAFSFGGLLIKPTIWTAAVSSLFVRGRGLALAVALCGLGIGSSLVPPLSNALINELGWRGSYMTIAGAFALVVLPVVALFFTSARDQMRREPASPQAEAAQGVLTGRGVKEALLSRHFAQLALATLAVTLAMVSFVMNLVPIMQSEGVSRDTAAGIAGIIGITSIIGRLVTGHLLDHFRGNIVGGMVVLFPVVSCLCFLFAPTSTAILVPAVIVLGLALGAEVDIIAYLATRYFGMRNYGTIFGCVVSLWSIATGLGPLVASYIYDTSGSYQSALWLYVPLLLISSVALFSMGAYPDFNDTRASATEERQ